MSNQLIIGIDMTPILYNRGVSRYTSSLINALAKEDVGIRLFGSSFRQNKNLKVLSSKLSKDIKSNHKPSILSFPPSFLSRMWYGVGRLHIESLMPKVDVFHAWEELIPPSYKTPIVGTIHDLAPFKFPQMVHPSTREKHMNAYKRLKEYNAHIIAVSEATKRDCIELLGMNPEKIHVIYEALPHESVVDEKQLLRLEELKSRFRITKPYFLWVGTAEPRKNLDRVIESWKQFKDDFDLVLVGANKGEIAPQAGIKVPGFVSAVELGSLYKQASILLFPSLYEGFGLPILEAFYYGCPVVTSNNSGMMEVGGEAAVLVDPFSVDNIVSGIRSTLNTKDVATRKKAMAKQLRRFSWEKAAKETLAVYQLAKRDGISTSP